MHEVLIASGAISETGYAVALARSMGVAAATGDIAFAPAGLEHADALAELSFPARLQGRPCQVLRACGGTPEEVSQRAASLRAGGMDVALAPRAVIGAAIEAHWREDRLDRAVYQLLRERPASSAAGPVWLRQNIAAAVLVGLVTGGFSVMPAETLAAVSAIMALPFLCVTLLRTAALGEVMVASRHPGRRTRARLPPVLADHQLPVYSVLVPLLRETGVVHRLVRALSALDYPPAKLEVFLVLEAADTDTQAALRGLTLPANFRVLVVPDAQPRTKPKALNYALQFTRGDYVVVYDAEDRPQPDQLRRALETFRRNPTNVGCVQAQLNIYNPRASWLSRQFTIEYSALFDAILPALARLGLPVPLGGTSNHFARETLLAVGGWDPFNVTEDADLGFRLARHGWRTAVVASTTWEEAPVALGQWLRQRTRWLKGWMQELDQAVASLYPCQINVLTEARFSPLTQH